MNDSFAPADKCALIRVAAPDPGALSPLETAARRRGAAAVDRTLRHLEAAFARPLAALRFGVYARGGEAPLRIGLHFGRPLASDHSDVARGPAARIVRRLTGLARSGQLLMTDAFFSQLASAGQTAFDARCREFGQYQLRPGGRLYRLHILAPEDETADPPPEPGETNLDRDASAFFGRASLLSRIGRELGRHRIVTLTGSAGVGKSRAAREFLREHRTRRPDADTWVVDLTHGESLQDVVDAIAATIGISLSHADSDCDPLVALGHALAARSDCVIVLDGADAVASEVAVCLQTLLPLAPATRWLVTARRPLNLVPELEIEVAGLPPDDAALLFQDRLDRAGRPFELDERNLEAVLDLVQAVDGSPLAVELVAHRCLTSPMQSVTAELVSTPADTVVASLIDRLVDELGEDERTLLAACTLAPAPFPIAIARRLIEPDDGDVDARLSSLRTRGLLEISPSPGPDETLYVEVPQAIADAVTERSPIADRLVERWLTRFAEWLVAEIGEPPWIRTAPLLDRLARQRQNLIFAAECGLDHSHDRAAIPLLALYTLVEGRRGPNVVATRLLETATVERAELFDATELAALQTVRSHLHTLAGDREAAAGIADQAVEHVDIEEAPDLATLAHLSRAHPRRSRLENEDPYAPAEAAAEEASPHIRAHVRMYRARRHLDRGAPSEAERYLRAAFDHVADDDSQLAARLERLAGELAAASFHFRKATVHLRRALALFRRLGYDREIGTTLRMLGRVAHDDGEPDRAISRLQETLSLARRTGETRAAARTLGELAGMAFKRQAFGCAREYLLESLEVADSHDWPLLERLLRAVLAATRAALGRVEAADDQVANLRDPLDGAEDRSWRPTVDLLVRIPEIARVEHGVTAPGRLADHRRAFLEAVSEHGDYPALAQRDALRCLDSYLTFVERGGRHQPNPDGRPHRPVMLIGPNGNWYRLEGGQPVDLSDLGPPRLIFDRLVRHRRAFPGQPLPTDVLADTGWPGPASDEEPGPDHVAAAIAALRDRGLERPLVERDDGYLVSPEFAVRYARR